MTTAETKQKSYVATSTKMGKNFIQKIVSYFLQTQLLRFCKIFFLSCLKTIAKLFRIPKFHQKLQNTNSHAPMFLQNVFKIFSCLGNNSSKMLNFEGMKCAQKSSYLKFFFGNSMYMNPRYYKYHLAQFIYNRGGRKAF